MGYDLTELAQAAQRLRNANMLIADTEKAVLVARATLEVAQQASTDARLEFLAAEDAFFKLALDGDPRNHI